jgi:hypothetical protein
LPRFEHFFDDAAAEVVLAFAGLVVAEGGDDLLLPGEAGAEGFDFVERVLGFDDLAGARYRSR